MTAKKMTNLTNSQWDLLRFLCHAPGTIQRQDHPGRLLRVRKKPATRGTPRHKKPPFQTNYTFSKLFSCFTHLLLYCTGPLYSGSAFGTLKIACFFAFPPFPCKFPREISAGQEGRMMDKDSKGENCKGSFCA